MIGSLLAALDEVHAGTLDPRQAGAMASLAGAITRAYSVGVLEDRLAALEGPQDQERTA
jgi:predicted P-loop ATPase